MDLRRGMSVRALVLNIVGALLVLAGIGLSALTAESLIDYHNAATHHGGEIVDLGANARPQAGQHGTMARIVGTPTVVEAPHDPDFNLPVSTPVLVRHVEMFQWREVRVANRVHYELDWVDHLLDASRFEVPRGHANPGAFPLSGKRFDAGLVQVGGFKLGPALLHALPGSERVMPRISAMPANLAATFTPYQDYLVTSTRPGEPRLGDVRVSWTAVPLQEVTVVGRIDGDRLLAATDAADGKGYMVQVGDVPVMDIFPDLPSPPGFVWGGRLLAILLAALGAFILLSNQRHRRDLLLAVGLGALAVSTVASLLWLGTSVYMTGGWVAVALVGLGLISWRLWRPR
ncbi:MAG TPA: TMEM43 family protein [Rhodanobacter sp.]